MILEDWENYRNCESLSIEPDIYFDDAEESAHTEVDRIQQLVDYWCLDKIDRVIIFARLRNIHTTETELAKLCNVTRQAISKRVRILADKSSCFPAILFYKPRAHERQLTREPNYKWKKEDKK